ncbi:MAG TPA: small multi-drug export protein [Candidatus Thermoplasmatota archaeon]|nr:small multi-drug export protein [Candidatus Thermoplasmatota archaeon]
MLGEATIARAPPVASAADAPRASWTAALPAFALAALVAGAVLLLAPERFWPSARLVGLYLVTPLGQEVWLLLAREQFGFGPVYAAGLLLAVNASVCLFFALAVPAERLAARLPFVGRRVARFEAKVRASRSAERSLALALAVLVALPIHSGGAIVGSLAGRLLGLRPPWIVAAVLGAVALRFAAVLAALYGVSLA